jgi:hypothetical protein
MSDPRLDTDADFILSKRFRYSLKYLLSRYPEGAPDEVIGQALGCSAQEVEAAYQGIVKKLQSVLVRP